MTAWNWGRTVVDIAPLREIDPQGIYHVMSRGNFRQIVFANDDEFARYLQLLQRVTARRLWTILDWCLIPNHVHLAIQLTNGGLSEGMRELNGGFSRWRNARTGRTGTGHLWKNRFKLLDLEDDVHFREVLRYIPCNPVRHGLVRHPEDWIWSGYRATIGLEYPYAFHRPSELLRFFGSEPAEAVRRYKAYVAEGLVRSGHVPWSDHGVGSRLRG
jgi:REP element-mobilizing transposase RayT